MALFQAFSDCQWGRKCALGGPSCNYWMPLVLRSGRSPDRMQVYVIILLSPDTMAQGPAWPLQERGRISLPQLANQCLENGLITMHCSSTGKKCFLLIGLLSELVTLLSVSEIGGLVEGLGTGQGPTKLTSQTLGKGCRRTHAGRRKEWQMRRNYRITLSSWAVSATWMVSTNFLWWFSRQHLQVFNAYQTVPHGRSNYTSNLVCAHIPVHCRSWIAFCLTFGDGHHLLCCPGSTSGYHSPLLRSPPRSNQSPCPGISSSAFPLLFVLLLSKSRTQYRCYCKIVNLPYLITYL